MFFLLASKIPDISNNQLAYVSILVLLAGSVSLLMKLKLEQKLFYAAVRCIIQLLLIGMILKWVFNYTTPKPIFLFVSMMLLGATLIAVNRPKRYFVGAHTLVFITLVIVGVSTTLFGTVIIIKRVPWYDPQFFIPILGMVLGNSMTGITLCIDNFLETLSQKSNEIEMELSMGASSWEAVKGPMRKAARTGMIPIINAMMAMGIVSLPGMMTGQILAGQPPEQAVRYQIFIMSLILTAVAMGCFLMSIFIYKTMFNHKHQLRKELIIERKGHH